MINVREKLLFAGVLVLCLLLGSYVAAKLFPAPLPTQIIQLLPQAKPLGDISFQDQQGQVFRRSNFSNHWTLLFFGFSSCPDLCPLELQKMAKVLRLAGDSELLQLVFVSLDPERDTPEILSSYTDFFHPQLVGISASNQDLATFTQFFGAAYSRSYIVNDQMLNVPAGFAMPENAGNDYQVNHSTRIFVVNPHAEFVGSFEPPHDPALIWADMQLLMQR
jgi:protein SCO1